MFGVSVHYSVHFLSTLGSIGGAEYHTTQVQHQFIAIHSINYFSLLFTFGVQVDNKTNSNICLNAAVRYSAIAHYRVLFSPITNGGRSSLVWQ